MKVSGGFGAPIVDTFSLPVSAPKPGACAANDQMPGLQADDRKATLVVGGGGETARRGFRVFSRDGRAFDRIARLVFDDAADAAGLRGGDAASADDEQRGQHAAGQMKTLTHAQNPL